MNFYLFALYITVSLGVCEDLEFKLQTFEREKALKDYILCRNCGTDIVDSYYLFPKQSEKANIVFNETLFHKDKVLVQVLSGPLSFDFVIITSQTSNCEAIGEWQWEEIWFPGFMWKPCVCPDCGSHIGWIFEKPDNSQTFFGLVLTHLIGESFADSLIRFPELV